MAWQDVAAKVVNGFAGAAGNPTAQAQVADWQNQRHSQQQNALKMQLAPLTQAISADRQKLTAFIDDKGNVIPEHQKDYDATVRNMTDMLGRMRGLMGNKAPDQDPNHFESTVANLTDKLHITRDLAHRLTKRQEEKSQQYHDQTQQMGNDTAAGVLPYAMTPEGQGEAAKARDAQALQDKKNSGMQNRPPAGRPVPFGRGSISARDARQFASDGMEFKDQDGNPIDVSRLPESSKVTPWAYGGKIFYTVGDQVPRVVTADNQRTVQPEEGGLTPAGQAPTLGEARVPTVGTHQVPGMNPGETVTLRTTTTPVTPGAKTSTSSQPATSGGRGTQELTDIRDQSRLANGQLPPQPAAFAPGTMLSQGKVAQPIVASMNTVAAQVFGGNGEPPLWESAKMFDNPELATALNKALTLNALTIPGTEDDPSFTQTLATALGVTGWSQEQIRDANAQAREDLQKLGGDDALKMFARLAGFQEDLSALRAATKGSAAQGSIRTLVRAAPVYNVSSSQNFRDQLGVTLNTAAAAMAGYPAISEKYVDWWKQGARMARGEKPSSQSPASSKEKVRIQTSASTGKSRYSTDGGVTWHPGKPPQNP